MSLRSRDAREVDPDALRPFLERCFGPAKARFLTRHGDWWHGGPGGSGGSGERRVIEVDGVIAGYSSTLPARVLVDGHLHDAHWWIDLVVAPEHRGRGLQRWLDQDLRSRSELLLGFPNAHAARIHRRHGWGVREDLRMLLAPLDPPRLPAVTAGRGLQGLVRRAAAWTAAPAAALWRRRLAGRETPGAHCATVAAHEIGELATLAARTPRRLTTTCRDAARLEHRYRRAPYNDELVVYRAADVALVTRRLLRRGRPVVRILDLFGDLDDQRAVRAVGRSALYDAARAGAVQVTALASLPELAEALRSCGFAVSTLGRFCWHSRHLELHRALGAAPCHWCLGDSDHDEPGDAEAPGREPAEP